MEIIKIIISLLSGVALFLYGMSLMGDSLKMVAGNKLEAFLYKMTNTPIKGIFLGAIVTAVIQSSSATSVMVVGFVNSGMMKMKQAIGIIMGANIGTSITGWILCLSYIEGSSGVASLLSTATISGVVAIIGICLRNFGKKNASKHVGNILLGFAILMVGMQTMSSAVSPLKTNPVFINAFTMFSNPFLGILIGIVFTAVLQSASAAVGILQALSITGVLTFSTCFPIIMGIGVGAACPVLLSAVGASKNGKRTALVYLMNDLFGMILWSVIFYTVNAFVHFPFVEAVMNPVRVALLNSVFRIATVVLLFPAIKLLEKIVFALVKDSEEDMEDQADFDILEERLLAYPALAIRQCHTAIDGMAKKVRKNVFRAFNLLNEYNQSKYNKVMEKEDLIDRYEDKLGNYLLRVTENELNPIQRNQVSIFLHTIGDLESIGDRATVIADAAQEIQEKSIKFSDEADKELAATIGATKEIIELTFNSLQSDDNHGAMKVGPLAELIGILCDELKLRHISRLSVGKMEQGYVFNDLVAALEDVASYCSNISVAMLQTGNNEAERHIDTKKLYAKNTPEYMSIFESYASKYSIT